jgi:hypothetical protein
MNANSFVERDADLTDKYHYSDDIGHEPVKAIQKEIDGMARLLCALVEDEEIHGETHQYLRVYQEEVKGLRELEEDIISVLPERNH